MAERNIAESVFTRFVILASDPSTKRVDPQRIQGALKIAVEVEQALTVDNKGVILPLNQNSTEGKLV